MNLIDGTAQLWIVNADGSSPRRLVGSEQLPSSDPNLINSPAFYEWQANTRTIFFDTRNQLKTGETGPRDAFGKDLWKVEADSGQVNSVIASSNVRSFALSPDGRLIALTSYESIVLIDAEGLNARHLIDFAPISTHSEYGYIPDVRWNPDSTFFSVAIPSTEPMAPDASVTLYRMHVDGSAQTLATLTGDFVSRGMPQIAVSPDGQYMAYGRRGDILAEFHLARVDGSDDRIVSQIQGHNTHTPDLTWSPDSKHFAYAASGESFIAAIGEDPPQPFATGGEVYNVKWIDNTHFVFYVELGGQFSLYQQRVNEDAIPITGPLGKWVTFEVK